MTKLLILFMSRLVRHSLGDGVILGVGLFFIFSSVFSIHSKEVIVEGSSRVKQTRFTVKSGSVIFTEKYQNINGTITEEWSINNSNVLKDEYYKQMSFIHQEEIALKNEDELRKKEEAEQARKVVLLKKQNEEKEFSKKLKLQTLKRLVSLEIDRVEKEFEKLDKYKLEEYFVFEHDTFYSSQDLENVKINLLNRARSLSVKGLDELEIVELKEILGKLEVLPKKINSFFRSSVKFAINNCNDTRKLKHFLSLI